MSQREDHTFQRGWFPPYIEVGVSGQRSSPMNEARGACLMISVSGKLLLGLWAAISEDGESG